MNQMRILVLMGGVSTEREVSLRSGAAVCTALREAGFEAETLDLVPENIEEIRALEPDAVFIALHGKGGEDGSIQGLLDWMQIPYTGPGVAASALCLDKIMTKKVLLQSRIPTPPFMELAADDFEDAASLGAALDEAVERLGLPIVLKACRQGSSIGTEIVREKDALNEVALRLFEYGDRLLLEQFLSGTELTVPILGNSDLRILPVIEICSKGEFYDYESKYAVGGSEHIIPARIPACVALEVQRIAAEAYRATGCQGHARVDVMLDENQNPFVIEINTSPGMTETSLFPDAARAVGTSFPELVKEMVRLATEK